jgi:uncharacterized delta-60 repeat protein
MIQKFGFFSLTKKFLWTGLLLTSICRGNSASYLDPSFDPGTGTDSFVETVLPLDTGKIMICGNFTKYDGTDRAYIARLNEDGSLDQSFNARPSYWVRALAVQGDGKIVIGGYFTVVESTSRNLIARLNQDGSLDHSFNPGSGCTNIIAGGVDGNMDPFVFWVAIQPDGKILLTGNFRDYNGESSVGIVRVNPDGTRDKSFNVGSGFDSWGRSIFLQDNGQILVTGWMTSYNNIGFNRIARINADGSADNSFHPFFGDATAIYTIGALSNGQYIAAGHSKNTENFFKREIARLNADGTQDNSFSGTANEKIESLFVQEDGRIVGVGDFTEADGTPRNRIARWNSDGSLDADFQADADNFVWTARPDTKGRILIGGGFYHIDGVSRNGVARLLSGTSVPPGPNPPKLTQPSYGSGVFKLTFLSEENHTYTLEYRELFGQGSWVISASVQGNGGAIVLTNRVGTASARYYRLRVQ